MCAIIELGGTVGDIESAPFVEAMRQLRRRAGRDKLLPNSCFSNSSGQWRTEDQTYSASHQRCALGSA